MQKLHHRRYVVPIFKSGLTFKTCREARPLAVYGNEAQKCSALSMTLHMVFEFEYTVGFCHFLFLDDLYMGISARALPTAYHGACMSKFPSLTACNFNISS